MVWLNFRSVQSKTNHRIKAVKRLLIKKREGIIGKGILIMIIQLKD